MQILKKINQNTEKLSKFYQISALLLFMLILVSTTAGCQPEETATPSLPTQAPTNTDIVPTATNTVIPPTDTIPAPTETKMPPPPPNPIPTEEPTPWDPVGYLLNIPVPNSGVAAVSPTTVISVRSGPGLNYPVYGLMMEEQTGEVVGISPDGAWWALRVLDVPLERAWVYAAYTDGSNTNEVPEIEPPPVPPTLVFAPPDISEAAYVRFQETIYAYSGPGEEFPVYGVIQQGEIARTFEKTDDQEWWQIIVYSNLVPPNLTWVDTKYVEVRRASTVAAKEAPPPPLVSELPVPDQGTPRAIPMAPVFLRSGPGIQYPTLGVASAGLPVSITAISPNFEWWQVIVPSNVSLNERAWIAASFTSSMDTDNIPTVDPPPLPEEIATFEPAAGDPFLLARDNIIAYAGPGNEWPALGMIPANEKAVVTGVSADGVWYIIRVPIALNENGQGWVRYDFVDPTLQRGVPVIEQPPK